MTKSLMDPTEMAGGKRGAWDVMCLEPQACFLLFMFLCLLNDHQQYLCFIFCFFFHYSVAWVLFYYSFCSYFYLYVLADLKPEGEFQTKVDRSCERSKKLASVEK